jgi:hypothetical protein
MVLMVTMLGIHRARTEQRNCCNAGKNDLVHGTLLCVP